MMTVIHTAIVTGADHGIGAATARALAGRGCAVLCTYLRVEDPVDPGMPSEYRVNRARHRGRRGGRPAQPGHARLLFDSAEQRFGPVDILVNNATGWLADSFAAAATDRVGRTLQPVSAPGWTRQFSVDAMGAALIIGEFARRHIARGASWGRIIWTGSGGAPAQGRDPRLLKSTA
jgi:3-oxoacyl-[acyl-carrier protein] reductase